MIAVVLDLGDPKSRYAGAIDRSPPGGKIFEAQSISFAPLGKAQHSAVDGRQHLAFTPADPMGGRGG